MDKERAKRIASNSARQAMARRAQRQAVVDASVARKKLAEQGVGEDQYKYYREMDIDSEQKRLEDLQRKQEVFKGFESLVGMGGTLDTPIYDGDTPIYFKDYFADYDQSIDLSTMEGRKQAITPYDRTSDINKLSKELDIARLAQSVNLDAKEDFKTYSVANNKATKALQKERRDSYLTPEEKRRYYYLYNTQGEGAAESYMRALQADLYSRGMQKVYDFADDNGWAGALASVGSVATSLLSGFEGAANLAAYAADKYIGLNEDAELRRGYLSDLTQAMRGGASADMGAGGSFVYDTVMSGVDSFLASFVPAGAVTLGLSAASQASNDILSRGGTGEQALVGGVAAGLFEGFFENFSISKLKSMDPDEITTSWKSFVKNIGKQVATNAQEEAATEAANIIFDTVAMGDISNAVLSYDRYVAEGMSEEDAKAKVIRDMALQIGAATASGALIGGAFGVGGAGVGAVARAKQGRSIVNDKGTKLNDLIEAGEATFVGDQYKGERELLEAVKANKSKNDVAQRNRVQKLDELLTKEAAERAKNAPTWAEQQKAMREAALKDVAGAVDKARGEAENAKIGKDITYTYMPSIANFSGAEGNSIFIEKSDGTTAKLSDLAVEDEELYEAYSLATSTGSVNNANAFIQNYRLHGNNVPVEEFWAAWIGAQNYGQTVTSEGAMEKAIAKYGTGNIPESALQAAFLSGRNMRTSTTEKYKATQEKYEKAWKDAGGKLTEARFNDNALKGKSLDKSQQEYRSFLRAFSRATGTNIEVFVSERGARKENGSYNRDTNTLRIDINAGIRNNANYTAMESSIVNTLSHEVVHNMRVTAPELYDALSAFVTETLQADENYNLDEAIEAEIEKGKQKDRELSREDAIEEIVARACEDRLGSSEKLRDFMIEFYAKDEKAANGFIKAVKEFIARLKSFFENIAKQKSSSEEAQLIAKQSAETIAEIQKRFDEALLAMREGNTARNAVEQVNVSIDAATESASPIMLSETTWRESEYVTKTEQAAAALAKALDVSTEDALKYIKNVNSVAKMIANDRARLDYFASSFGSAFVSNVEYGGSFDFTTLCKKRRIYTGTFSEIQKRLGEVALTPDQILEIRNLLIAARYEVPCGLCYVEGSRANMGKFAKKFIELYKRDNPGAWIPKMVDVNTPDGVEQMHRMHPECYEQYEYFWNHYGKLKDSDPALFASQQKPKLYEARKAYKNEILELFKTDTNVTNKNRNGGIRMQSFSDFEIVHAIDTMQIIMDMSRVGLAGQAYTKVPEFAKAFGDTGLKINLSLIAKGVDENGKIIFDDREGMPHETAFNIRKKHSENVGTILVIFNDAQLYAAMADDRIDFIIQFHRSQWKKGQYAAMGLPAGTKDYTYMQNEKLIKPTYHEYQGRMVKDKASNYMPNAYWDFSKSGKENAEAYLKMCAENNKRPKFYKLLDYDGNGTYSLKKDGSTDGYWKLLVDFKMYDNEGNGSPQTPVRPDFSMTEIRKMLKEYEGGHASYPVAHDVVDKFVDMYKAQETAKSSTLLTQPVKVGASLGGTMFQERVEQFQTEYEQQVDNVMNGVYKGDDVVMIGRTPEALTKIGVNQLPLTITPAHIYSIAKTEAEAKAEGRYDKRFNYHGLGAEAVKQIGKKLSSPLMVLTHQEFTESQRKNHVSEHRVVVVVELEINGRQVICPIEIDADIKIGTNRYDVNHITTYFDKKAFDDLIGEAIAKETIGEVGFYYIKNEKKAHEILQGSGYQLPQQLASRYASMDIIRHIDTNVNRKIENFLGSKQFIRWFGDWMNDPMRASKIVDDNGVPMVVYHGTNTDFSIFDINKSSNTTKRYIDGFYFTTEQKVAKKIADLVSKSRGGDSNVLAVYLDVKKPLVLTAEEYQKIGFNDKWRNEVLNRLSKGKHDGVIIKPERERVEGVFADSYNYDADASVYNNAEKYGITDKDYAWWLNRAVSNPDFTATQIAVFKPEQVKSATDNIGTYDKGNTNMFYQDRIETPEPSEVLRKYFAGNETYEGYKPYVESLKKYRDLMERVEVLDAKIDALNENIARLRSEHRQSGKGTRMDDLYKQKQNTEKRVEELRNRMFAMEAKELRRVVEAESKRVISDVRRAETERFAEKSKERRENASKSQYIESIGKRTKAISELFAKNNAEKHIPDELKAPIAELMTALDFSSKRSLSGGDMTQKEEKLKAAVKRITELSALTNGQGLPALDLPPRFQKEWDAVKEAISVHTWGKGTMYPSQMILENMNSSDLRALNRSLMDIQHAINVANDVISQANAAPISALSKDLVKYLDDEVRQRKAQSDNLWQDTKNLLVWENTLPVYAFDRLGGTGRILFESFQNGFDQLVGEVNQIKEYTESAYKFKEVKEWRKQVHSFECKTLSGDSREIHLTVPQIMSFYCLSKREHAMPHFKGGGIVSEDIKAGKEKYKNDANGVRLTDETIVKILSTLTARQREVADKLQSFLNTECSAWGNEVSMKRYGIRMFTEQNYFPIRTKGSERDISETNAPQNTKMYALLNMSFSKPLTELAKNQIVISDIFEVFADHSNSMARYHSLALPVLDYMKVYNYREKIKSGDDTDTSYEQKNVRDSVKNAYGDAGLKYFEQFITGINGANWTQDSNKLSAALTKSAKTAMVGFNLRTVVQQPTSAVRALMYLGLDDMTLSLNPTQIKKGHELAVKYCAMAKWKSMGYFDIGTGRGMERMLVGDETWKDKTIEASMYMAGKADELTLAYMWNACERWVSKHDRTLKKDTEEYYKAVGNKLREVIYRSQVVDSPLTRSKFMNSPSEFNKMLAMFGAEPTVTYNMALDVAYKIASAKSRKQAWGEQRRQLAGFIGIYATQALLLAAVQSAMDAIRDDDDEPYGDKYMDEFWTNLLLELEPLSKLPILRDIVSALEGYATSRIDTTLWSKLSYLFKDVEKLIKGKDVTLYKWVYDILSAASTATGVAASNLVRDIVALWNTIIGSFFPHLKIKK